MKTLYVAFLSTPYRMGKMIRAATRREYNHVALSLSRDLEELYSFARVYRDLPLCGAFVRETPERYLWESGDTKVQICAIPMTPAQERKLRYTLSYFSDHASQTVYNHFAALLSPFGMTVDIRGAYTCEQFVQSVLGRYFPETGVTLAFPLSVPDLMRILAPYRIYKGLFPDCEKKCRFDYYEPHGTGEKLRRTAATAFRLLCRLGEGR